MASVPTCLQSIVSATVDSEFYYEGDILKCLLVVDINKELPSGTLVNVRVNLVKSEITLSSLVSDAVIRIPYAIQIQATKDRPFNCEVPTPIPACLQSIVSATASTKVYYEGNLVNCLLVVDLDKDLPAGTLVNVDVDLYYSEITVFSMVSDAMIKIPYTIQVTGNL